MKKTDEALESSFVFRVSSLATNSNYEASVSNQSAYRQMTISQLTSTGPRLIESIWCNGIVSATTVSTIEVCFGGFRKVHEHAQEET